MNKRAILANTLGATGVSAAMIAARRATGRRLPLLAYHRVLSMPDPEQYPFDTALVSADPDSFRFQLRFIKRHFTPVRFADVIRHLDGVQPLPRDAIVVTFDDGFEDNHSNAFPILAEEGVPATFFISSGYLGSDRTFWFDWLSCIVMRTSADSLDSDVLGARFEVTADHGARRRVYAKVVQALKCVEDATRLAALDELDSRYGDAYTSLPEKVRALSRPMSAEQAREMADGGMEIGSHTINHAILARQSSEQIRYELQGSRKALRSVSGQPVEVLSYPNGGYNDFNDTVTRIAREVGFRLGISYISGDNRLGDMDLFSLRRIHVEGDVGNNLFKLLLALPDHIE